MALTESKNSVTSELDTAATDPTYTRRKFLSWGIYAIGAGVGVAIGVPAVAYFIEPAFKGAEGGENLIELGTLQELANQTTPRAVAKEYKYRDSFKEVTGNKQVFVRAKVAGASRAEDFEILDSTCTHAGCAVSFDSPIAPAKAKGKFYCPCHASIFDVDGKNLEVAPAPLAKYTPVVKDGKLSYNVFKTA